MGQLSTKEQIKGRMYIVVTGLAVFTLFIVGQLTWIHMVEGETLRNSGLRQAQSQTVLMAKRGTILDRKERALVVNTPRYDVALDPMVPGFDEEPTRYIRLLAQYTGRSIRAVTRQIERRASPRFVRIGSITNEQRQVLDTLNIPGLIVHEYYQRQYNYGTVAGHMLGHVDRDAVGQAGIELQYDEYLQGIPGRQTLPSCRRRGRRGTA